MIGAPDAMLEAMHPNRRTARSCAVLMATLVGCGALGSTAPARPQPAEESYPCLSLRDPSYAQVRSELWPGERVSGVVELVNGCARPVVAQLRTGRTGTGADGAMAWSPEPSGAGALTVEHTEVIVAAGASEWVPFTVSAAVDAAPGDHPLALGAVRDPADRPAGVVDTWRPVPLRIAGALRPAVEITSMTGVYEPNLNPFEPGSAEIGFTVTNTGSVTMSGYFLAGLEGLYRRWVLPDPTALPMVVLVPGASYSGIVRLPEVWPGVRFDTQIAFLPPDSDGATVSLDRPEVLRAETLWALPFAQMVLAVLVGTVLFVAAVVRHNRYRRRAVAAPPDGPNPM
ncbi:hypothetical protein ACL02S_02660 [Nocardia sp. 004]|uniref:COG1470 family protein n=1 Tax=Nocardia sp. 004 TaxID=3385978 RepID=UPI0039A379A8